MMRANLSLAEARELLRDLEVKRTVIGSMKREGATLLTADYYGEGGSLLASLTSSGEGIEFVVTMWQA